MIPLSGAMLKASLAARIQFSLQPQDSIVFASVDHFLKEHAGAESVFANKKFRRTFPVQKSKPILNMELTNFSRRFPILGNMWKTNWRGRVESVGVGARLARGVLSASQCLICSTGAISDNDSTFRWKNCFADVLSNRNGQMVLAYIRGVAEPSLVAIELQPLRHASAAR